MSVYKNAKSQMTTIRVPHDVMEGMESVKLDGESNAGFIVTAMRGEIARRQAEGAEEIGQLVAVAREELQRRKAKESE